VAVSKRRILRMVRFESRDRARPAALPNRPASLRGRIRGLRGSTTGYERAESRFLSRRQPVYLDEGSMRRLLRNDRLCSRSSVYGSRSGHPVKLLSRTDESAAHRKLSFRRRRRRETGPRSGMWRRIRGLRGSTTGYERAESRFLSRRQPVCLDKGSMRRLLRNDRLCSRSSVYGSRSGHPVKLLSRTDESAAHRKLSFRRRRRRETGPRSGMWRRLRNLLSEARGRLETINPADGSVSRQAMAPDRRCCRSGQHPFAESAG
jgi:Zn-finger nucleic acid-binding protein